MPRWNGDQPGAVGRRASRRVPAAAARSSELAWAIIAQSRQRGALRRATERASGPPYQATHRSTTTRSASTRGSSRPAPRRPGCQGRSQAGGQPPDGIPPGFTWRPDPPTKARRLRPGVVAQEGQDRRPAANVGRHTALLPMEEGQRAAAYRPGRIPRPGRRARSHRGRKRTCPSSSSGAHATAIK
jgi:hypothetical protein